MQNMLGVTIGVGDGWGEVAQGAAAQMSAMTGLKCAIIQEAFTEVVHPSWLKCFIHRIEDPPFSEYDSFMIFDADIMCIKPWSPRDLFINMGRPFIGALENVGSAPIICESFKLRLNPSLYINGGLAIYGREHGEIWDGVAKFHPRYGTWLEQSAINEVLQQKYLTVPQVRLPCAFNRMVPYDPFAMDKVRMEVAQKSAVNLHMCNGALAHTPESLLEFQEVVRRGLEANQITEPSLYEQTT